MNPESPDFCAITPINEQEFQQFQRLFYSQTGIFLSPAKKPLLTGRLNQRLRQLGLQSYGEYYRAIVQQDLPNELQVVIDCLTTNETSFFREPKHFDFLRELCKTPAFRERNVRVWCAASSSGEEPYTIAMVLADALPHERWEVFASDVNSEVLAQARAGQYSLQRSSGIPPALLRRYCLKGTGSQEGTFAVGPELRSHLHFQQINLVEPLPNLGQFDVIMLRNVLIYFQADVKQRVVMQARRFLKSGGYFIVGHSESLLHMAADLSPVSPSVYRRT